MKELLQAATVTCHENYATQKNNHRSISESIVIESSYIYSKFKGLGFRMRELSSLLTQVSTSLMTLNNYNNKHNNRKSSPIGKPQLTRNNSNQNWIFDKFIGTNNNTSLSPSNNNSNLQPSSASDLFIDIKQFYTELRLELLKPLMLDILSNSIRVTHESTAAGSNHNNHKSNGINNTMELNTVIESNVTSLCFDIRTIFITLLRTVSLELHLFYALFDISDFEDTNNVGNIVTTTKHKDITSQKHCTNNTNNSPSEVCLITDLLCKFIEEQIRPRIIKEYKLEELCHIITILQHELIVQVNSNVWSPHGNVTNVSTDLTVMNI